jgi:hypothetical protein
LFTPPTEVVWQSFLEQHPDWRCAGAAIKEVAVMAKSKKKKHWRESDANGGKYLSAVDVPEDGKKTRVKSIYEDAPYGDGTQLIAELSGFEKDLPLNVGHCEFSEKLADSPDPDDWEGPPFIVYRDPSVRSPKGETTGGVRFREAKSKKKAQVEVDDEDLRDLEDDDDD